MQDLANQLGITGLEAAFADFGLTAVPNLPLNTETAELEPMADPLLAGIGQENLLVTPLQLALAWSALGNNGRLPQPRLVTAVQNETGEWETVVPEAPGEPIITETGAQAIRRPLIEDSLVSFSSKVLSGPEGNTNVWYLGLAPAINPRYAVVVVVENSDEVTLVEGIGRTMLQTAVSQP
jgi:cell division protein FtsI/penicillin-binding protein 2